MSHDFDEGQPRLPKQLKDQSALNDPVSKK